MGKMGAALLAGVMLVALMGFSVYQLGAGNRLAQSFNDAHDSDVVMYSAAWCPACAATREYLTARGQTFVELDMEKNPEAAHEFAQFGGHGIPLVLAKGEVIRGHRPSELNRILAPAVQ